MGITQSSRDDKLFELILPREIWEKILQGMINQDAYRLRRVCKCWYFILKPFSLPRIVPPELGLQLWMDACATETIQFDKESKVKLKTDFTPNGLPVKIWRSLVGKMYLHVDQVYCRDDKKTNYDIADPVFIRSVINGLPGIFFDYGHSASICEGNLSARTIVSVHSWEFQNRLDHMAVHKIPGELYNFYIFTSSVSYFMHTNSNNHLNNLFSYAAHEYFRAGKIRVDGKNFVPVAESSRWTDQGLHLAVLEMYGTIRNGLDMIGADRDCNQYCGTIAELLVYDRVLDEDEVMTLENSLMEKYGLLKEIDSKECK